MITIHASGSVLTPAIARQLAAILDVNIGLDDAIWVEMHPSLKAEWEKCGIPVQRIDPCREDEIWKRTFMGFPLELNPYLSDDVIQVRRDREILAQIVRLGKISEVANAR